MKILIAITAQRPSRSGCWTTDRDADIHVCSAACAAGEHKKLPAGLRLPGRPGSRPSQHERPVCQRSNRRTPWWSSLHHGHAGAHRAGRDDLLLRAADVVLKEKEADSRPARNAVNLVHVKNFELLLLAGATILPANPGFYAGAKTIVDLADTVVARVLDHLGVANQLAPRWQEAPE